MAFPTPNPKPEAQEPRSHNTLDGTVSGVALQATSVNSVTITPNGGQALSRPENWLALRVRDADPRALGVHPTRWDQDSEPFPPYVERDQDTFLRMLLTRAAATGGAVLVEGDSTAGKTRTALRALQVELPDRLLFAPAPGQNLNDLVDHLASAFEEERVVLWLDDLNRFLDLGDLGLTEHTLQHLCVRGHVVMATLRSEFVDLYEVAQSHHDPHAIASGEPAHGDREDVSVLLRRFTQIELDRLWSEEEITRANRQADRRLAEAVANHGVHGVAEYLAAGPELLHAWNRAKRSTARGGHPRGHAVVAAAVDLARTGMLTAPDRGLLEQAHFHYMANTAPYRPEPFQQALEWAQQPGRGVSGLLIPAESDDGEERWKPFDYLVEAATTTVPLPLWELALEQVNSLDERLTVATGAHESGQRALALGVCSPLADEGHPRAMNLMGYWAAKQDPRDEANAERWFRKASEAGNKAAMNNLANLLGDQGRISEAEEHYRRCIDLGNNYALKNFAIFLEEQDRLQEADLYYWRSVESGDSTSLLHISDLLLGQRRYKAAEGVLRDAVDTGQLTALHTLGGLLGIQGRDGEAEDFYRRAVRSGDTEALIGLGVTLFSQGMIARSIFTLKQAMEDSSGAINIQRKQNVIEILSSAEDILQNMHEIRDAGSALRSALAEENIQGEEFEEIMQVVDAIVNSNAALVDCAESESHEELNQRLRVFKNLSKNLMNRLPDTDPPSEDRD